MAHPETPARISRTSPIGMTSPQDSDDHPRSPNPASSLLQDLLREKKAENRRLGRASDANHRRVSTLNNAFDDRDVQSSPILPPSCDSGDPAHARRTSAFSGRDASAAQGMGMREMEQVSRHSGPTPDAYANRFPQYISKLNKQNFDLKLELFHRRQRNEILETELAKMQELEGDNAELQSINEELVKELELRDAAVQEAVELICQLEAKVESIETTEHSNVTPTRAACNSVRLLSSPPQSYPRITSPSTPPPHELHEDHLSPIPHQGLPQEHLDLSLLEPSKSARRAPSFLREDQPSTSALRSLYTTETNASYMSLNRAGSPQKDLDPDNFTLNSPRLSMLSESSFMSVYGTSPRAPFDPLPPVPPLPDLNISRARTPMEYKRAEKINPVFTRGLSDASIKRARDKATRSAARQASSNESEHRSERSFLGRVKQSTKTKRRSSSHSRSEHLSKWLDEAVSADEGSPPRHPSNRQLSQRARRSSPKPAFPDQFSSIGEVLHKPKPNALEETPTPPVLTKPIFVGPEILPPTPDTMSTAQKANSSTPSIITEKSIKDTSRPSRSLHPTSSHQRSRTKDSLGLDFENDISSSDDEHHSVRAQRSEADSTATPLDAFDSFSFMGSGNSLKAKRMLGDTPLRPRLATNPADAYASRALSYPSPKAVHRRSSIANSPTRPEPVRGVTTQAPLSPKKWISKGAPSPSSPDPRDSQAPNRSVRPPHDSGPAAAESPPAESKIPKTTSSRLKTLFRRSNSQSSTAVLAPQQHRQQDGGESQTGAGESRIARPGTAGGGGGVGRSASGKVFGRGRG